MERQLQLMFFRPETALRPGAYPLRLGKNGPYHNHGPFLEASLAMAGVNRPRHPERTVLFRVLFHYFDRFLAEYENRLEKEYGFFDKRYDAHPAAT